MARILPPKLPPLELGLVLALMVIGQLEAVFGDITRPLWLHVPGALVMTGALLWRRRAPLIVLILTVAGLIGLDAEALSLFVATVVAAYSAGAELEPRRAWIALAIAVAPLLILFATVADGTFSDFVAPVVLYGGAWGAGRLVWERGRRARAHADRADTLEREQDRRTEEATLAERARIARELHDVVSHSISVIAIQTQAIRRRLGPEHRREADDLHALEVTARDAMGEMRRLFGILRAADEPASLAPAPGLADIDALVGRTRVAGLPVELQRAGDPEALPAGVDLAAYRIVQEALTNALRHAQATRAQVGVHINGGTVEVSVVNDGVDGNRPAGAAGHGLIGMRERVALYGGRLDTHTRGGEFTVRAVLPYADQDVR